MTGESGSHFTGNEIVFSQFTKKKIGNSRFTENKKNVFFFKVSYRHILLCQKLWTFLNSEELPAVYHIKFLKDTFNTNGGGCSSVRKAACLYRCTTKQGRHFITPQRTHVAIVSQIFAD